VQERRKHAQGKASGEDIYRESETEMQPFLVATSWVAQEDSRHDPGDNVALEILDVHLLPFCLFMALIGYTRHKMQVEVRTI